MKNAKVYWNHNFLIAVSASMMVMMIAAAIVPAFPKIITAFNINAQEVGLLITAYTLPGFVFGPLGGVLADRLGRKRLLIGSLLLFGVFGGSCYFARNFNTLLILRVAQGLCSAPLGGIGLTIISDIYSGRQRAQAIGLNTTAMYTGYIIYPLIGGALAGIAWNYTFLIFYVSIPIALTAIFILDCPEPERKQTLKQYLGTVLHYLKSWKVAWLFLACVLAYVILYGGFLNYFSILLGNRFQASPFIIGLFISLVGLMTALGSLAVGKLSQKFAPGLLVMAAFVIYAISMALIPLMPGIWFCLIPIVIYGFAHGINLPCLIVIASDVTPLEQRAGFMALRSTMLTLGMTLAPVIMGLIYSLTDLNNTFYIAGIISLIVPVMAVILGVKRISTEESK
jgi:MFS transporter, ACDE family, multidrug resistance protein